ncbi:MAG TPA: metallophosphoesterase [Patescibacteria group bacterium]|nr:metallophosphoesterase [Patescibacteria group bacterium]
MINFKEFIYNVIGKLYIPIELSESKEKRLLHVSDTPASFYSDLKLLIERLKPDYIVHTGDFVDNIKLQLYPTSIYDHEKWIKRLRVILEDSDAEIILALGNHDNAEIVSKHFRRSHIISEAETVKIGSLSFRISHMPKGVLEEPAQYNLFGHDLTLKNGCIDDKLYFNGISYINIIGLESGECTTLCYPSGIDDARLGRHKIGL